MKRNKGITLIALVITIIVLLILAGVAISMLSGENGILSKAADAKTKTEEKSLEEQIKLAVMGATEAGTSKVDKQKIADELGINKKSINGDAKDIVLTKGDKTYNLENGKLEEVSPIKEIDNVLDEYFQEKNLTYKCRYGYVTGIELGTTVEKLQGTLPTGYLVKAIDGTTNFTAKNKEDELIVTTGLQIVDNEGQEVARTVIFGSTDTDGSVTLNDCSSITKFIAGKKEEFKDYQIAAMDVNHDGKVDHINNDTEISSLKSQYRKENDSTKKEELSKKIKMLQEEENNSDTGTICLYYNGNETAYSQYNYATDISKY